VLDGPNETDALSAISSLEELADRLWALP